MNILLSGSSGFLGRSLTAALLRSSHKVSALSHKSSTSPSSLPDEVRMHYWDDPVPLREAVSKTDAIINLSGASVGGKRWTPEYKEQIYSSRILTTRRIVELIQTAKSAPKLLINASAVGYYGDCGEELLAETHPPGNDFLSHVCVDWEKEAMKAEDYGVRVCLMRTGIVLGRGGGALSKILCPASLPINIWKLGLGGRLGSGNQWMPWIHLSDVVGLYIMALSESRFRGAINLTSPAPVRNSEFTQALAAIHHRPALLPAPSLLLRLLLGEFSTSILGSQNAHPQIALRLGYPFNFSDLHYALRDILSY